MAITRIAGQSGRGTSQTNSISVTLAQTPTAGNILIACIGLMDVDKYVVNSITQTNVDWTLQKAQMNGTAGIGADAEIWLGVVGAGASTNIAIALSGTVWEGIADVYEYSGVLTSGFLDKTAGAYNTGEENPKLTGTTAVTTQANELWIGAVLTYSQIVPPSTPANGFTLLDAAIYTGSTGNAALSYLEKIVSAVGTAGSSVSLPVGEGVWWAGAIATFKGISYEGTILTCLWKP